MRSLLLAGIVVAVLATPALAAMDIVPLAPADEAAIQGAMNVFIKDHTKDGHYVVYDALGAGMVPLTFKLIHPGVRMIGGFYVSCIDFNDAKGTLYDIDMMVAKEGAHYKVYQDLIHAVGGERRAYHNER
jgi:signal transduction histidine kinase